jgi:hypothetical protein
VAGREKVQAIIERGIELAQLDHPDEARENLNEMLAGFDLATSRSEDLRELARSLFESPEVLAYLTETFPIYGMPLPRPNAIKSLVDLRSALSL